jgi:hypothetical protein
MIFCAHYFHDAVFVFYVSSDWLRYEEIRMDWKLDRQKMERNLAFARSESAAKIDMLEKMDREFEKIFGVDCTTVISPGRGKAGDPVRRGESLGRVYPRKDD